MIRVDLRNETTLEAVLLGQVRVANLELADPFQDAVPCWAQSWTQVQMGRMSEAGFYRTLNKWS